MIKITDDVRKQVCEYLDSDEYEVPDEFYAFYYRCMKAGMHYLDADRYAALNTLFGYDIGMDNAGSIDEWMHNNDEEIFELNPENENDKKLVALAVAEMGLNLNFSKWIKEDYEGYKFFEK